MSRTPALLAAIAFLLSAQVRAVESQERGGFVTTLGRDTLAMERFTWTAEGLSGEAVITMPRVQRFGYTVRLGADHRPAEISYTIALPGDTSPALSIRTTIGRDSIRFARTQGSRTSARAEPAVDAPVFPENLYTWALYEFATRATRAANRGAHDSVEVLMVSPGGPKPYVKAFRIRSHDTLSTMFFYPEYWTNYIVDSAGRLLGIDGSHTTIKVAVVRAPDVPLEEFARAAMARQAAAGFVGSLSRADSVTASLGAMQIGIAYSRPARRGRSIWGDVVPFGTVWRTGADAATRLHLSHDVEIGGRPVPAGGYTIFTLPNADSLTLILNEQVGQWGTEYHPERDLLRVPMTLERLPASTELFTIAFIARSEDEGMLTLEWGEARWSVAVRRARR